MARATDALEGNRAQALSLAASYPLHRSQLLYRLVRRPQASCRKPDRPCHSSEPCRSALADNGQDRLAVSEQSGCHWAGQRLRQAFFNLKGGRDSTDEEDQDDEAPEARRG